MGNRLRLIGWILAVVAGLVFSPVIFSQTAQRPGAARVAAIPRTPDGKPDLSGVWEGVYDPAAGTRYSWTKEPPPLQREAFYKYKYNNMKPEGGSGADNLRDPQGRDEVRPSLLCMPVGMPATMIRGQFEILQSPRRVLILYYSGHRVRQIWTDGREHPKDADPTWMGHSIARWDRDTLVVETIGITEHTWMDLAGTPHSYALQVVERFRRVQQNTLEAQFLFNDPKVLTKPWGAKGVWRLQPDGEVSDNNWDGKTIPDDGYVRCEYEFDDWIKGRTFHLPK